MVNHRISLLDQLDPSPAAPRDVIESVRIDLERLLSTHRVAPGEDFSEASWPDEYGVDRSLVEQAAGSASPDLASRLCRHIERAIARYEPRLQDVRVGIAPSAAGERLKLHLAAMIRPTGVRRDPLFLAVIEANTVFLEAM